MNREEIIDDVVEAIVTALESFRDIGQWKKPWRDSAPEILRVGNPGKPPWRTLPMPRNGKTGKLYRGVNRIHLTCAAYNNGWESNDWFTEKYAKQAGGQIRRGENPKTGVVCVIPFTAKRSNSKARSGLRFGLRYYPVFNREQCEGLENWIVDGHSGIPLNDEERIANVENFLRSLPGTVNTPRNRACYIPGRDLIEMPNFHTFTDPEQYYATFLHEYIHWTGHKDRLNRGGGRFGDDAYAIEELVAEFGSAFLCKKLRVDGDLQHTEYINSWIKQLTDNKKIILSTTTSAEKAYKFLLKSGSIED